MGMVALLCGAPFGAFLIHARFVRSLVLTQFHRRGLAAAEALSGHAQRYLRDADFLKMEETAQQIQALYGAVGACVLDGEKVLRATSNQDLVAGLESPADLLLRGATREGFTEWTASPGEVAGFSYSAPIRDGEKTIGWGVVVLASEPLLQLDRQLTVGTTVSALAIVAGLFIFYVAYLRRMRIPIERFVEATRRLAEGRSPNGIELPEKGEFGRLSAAFRTMSDQLLSVLGELKDAGRNFTPRRYSSYISHEIRNALHRMLGLAAILNLKATEEPGKVPELTEDLERQILTLNQFCTDIMKFARPVSTERREVDLNSIARGLARDFAPRQDVTIKLALAENLPPITADPAAIERALLNIVKNGMEAMPEGGVLGIATKGLPEDHRVQIVVSDSGCGMSESRLARLFQPFESTKPDGTGLGLAIVSEIVRAHSAKIEVTSQIGSGSVFTITFPGLRGSDAT